MVALTAAVGAEAEPVVTATVDRNRVAVGEQITLTIDVSDEKGHSVARPSISSVSGVQISGPIGPSTSRNVQIVNGRVSQTTATQFVFHLVPREAASFTIPSAEIVVDGTKFATRPLRIDVVGGGKSGRVDATTAFDIVVSVGGDTVWLGDGIIVEYSLRERVGTQVSNRQISGDPTFTGAWVEKLFDARTEQAARSERIINGERFSVMPILRVAVFPTSAGVLSIPSMGMTATVGIPTGRRNFWGEQVYRGQTVQPRSPERAVVVKPLPPGAPRDFSGVVGHYALRSAVDRSEVQQGDPVTWTIVLEGEGNVNGVAEPSLPSLADFQAYDPQVSTDIQPTVDAYRGRRTWERVLLPLHPGPVDVPAATLSYFDTHAGRYRTVGTRRHRLTVLARSDGDVTPGLALSQSEVRRVGNDIRFIHADAEELPDDRRTLWHSTGYWVIHALALTVLLSAGVLRLRRERLGSDPIRMRAIGARSEARRRLRVARERLAAHDAPGAIGAVRIAVAEIAAGHAGLSAMSLTTDELREALAARDVPPEAVERAVDVVARADRARFAPSTADENEAQRVYDEGNSVIGELMGHLRA